MDVAASETVAATSGYTVIKCAGSRIGPDGVRVTCEYPLGFQQNEIWFAHVGIRITKQGLPLFQCPHGHERGFYVRGDKGTPKARQRVRLLATD